MKERGSPLSERAGRPEGLAIGAYLRSVRRSNGLTQAQLAERAFVSSRTIGEIESGAQPRPRADTLNALEFALELAPGTLVSLAARERDRTALRPSTAPLIGRDDELTFALRVVRDGDDLTIFGAPGNGLRRFAAEVEALADDNSRGRVVLSNRRNRVGRTLELRALPERDARRLVARVLGDERLESRDPRIAALCGRVDHRPALLVALAKKLNVLGLQGPAVESAIAAALALTVPAYDIAFAALSAPARRAVQRFGVFARTCDPGALLAVSPCDDIATVIDELREVAFLEGSSGGTWAIPQSVLAYVRSRHPASCDDETKRTFIAWSLASSTSSQTAINRDTAAQIVETDALIDEYERAIALARELDLPSDAMRIASNLWYYYWSKGEAARGLGVLRPLLDRCDADELAVSPAIAAEGYARAASLAHASSRISLRVAARWAERSVELFEKAGEPSRALLAMIPACSIWYELGDIERARTIALTALQVAREIGETSACGVIYNNLGAIHEEVGDLDAALEAYRAAASLFTVATPTVVRAFTLSNIGATLARSGRHSESLAVLRDALRCAREARANAAIVLCLRELAETYHLCGRSTRAATLATMALELARTSGNVVDLIAAAETAAHALVTSSPARAARLYGAVDALRLRTDRVRRPPAELRRRSDFAILTQALGAAGLERHRLAGIAGEFEGVTSDAAASSARSRP